MKLFSFKKHNFFDFSVLTFSHELNSFVIHNQYRGVFQNIFIATNVLNGLFLQLHSLPECTGYNLSLYASMRRSTVKQLVSLLVLIIFSINYGWFVRYSMVGYNFTFKNSLRRRLLKLNLGYSRHRFLINIPKEIFFFKKNRRKLTVFSNNFKQFFSMVYYIFNLRNVAPYKIRGLVLEDSYFSILKVGKKVKFK
jgi:ribosomal protein L6P/L9E